MNILEIEHLSKIDGSGENAVKALDDVSFSVQKGEFVAIIGPSGSGKSTLLHILGGVDKPTSGNVYMDGSDIYTQNEEQLAIFRRRQVGLIYQFYNLIPVLNVEENITLPLLLDGQKINQAHLKELIEMLGLTGREKHLPNQLSGGQQQRVAIARTLAMNPDVILLDEPISALDVTNREIMKAELKALQKKFNVTMLFITHDQEEAFFLSDRIMIMNGGQIEQMDVPLKIYNEPANAYVKEFVVDQLDKKYEDLLRYTGRDSHEK